VADSGLTEYWFEVDTRRLIAGGYLVKWRSRTNGSEGEFGLTVLPQFDAATIRRKLNSEAISIRQSSLTTLEFKLEEVVEQIASTKPYETCLRPRFRLTRLQNEIDEAMTGKDPYSERTGFVRKAYRSDVDSTLQPYMVWIPEDFDPEATYPLLVYLHGSASTEYNLSGSRKMIPEGFIALAPRGRGTSNCYTFDHAQEDIAEAMASVIDDYPIDTTRIILAGFSMGGYGVYRTFYETPEKFRALAIFSGHPDIANFWYPGNDYPDFTGTEMLKLFRDVPMFVFHGEGDRNAPYEITERVVTELKRLGSKVEFHPEADKGHEEASDQTYEAYYDWVRRVLRH
jgi:dipeptidyl aminopeptidase/acylaminoacyl peptidase